MQNTEIIAKRTIESILDLQTGKEILASEFFQKPIDEIFRLRYLFESAIREKEPRFVCYFCKQSIKIRGQATSKNILHFAHLRDSKDCSIKTNNNLTKIEVLRIKYNGAKESNLHIELKSFIANALLDNKLESKGIDEVGIEKINKHNAIPHKWKRPDVSCSYRSKSIVFEIQLSTTFLSVINSRQEFYKNNKTFILWVFNSFDTDDERRKFTQSDVLYNNNRNGFELDALAREKSIEERDLVLKCNYLKPFIKQSHILFKWEFQYVKLSDLTFLNDSYQAYFYDVDGNYERLKLELKMGQAQIINLIMEGELSQLNDFFSNGYSVSTAERNHIISLFTKYIIPINTIDTITVEYKIIWATILIKLEHKNLIKEFIEDFHLRKTVTDILSLKLKKVIGYAYQNQVQISHRLMEMRPEHMELYLKAINQYYPNLYNEQDKTNKLKKKINKIRQTNINQSFNRAIIQKLFPELAL